MQRFEFFSIVPLSSAYELSAQLNPALADDVLSYLAFAQGCPPACIFQAKNHLL